MEKVFHLVDQNLLNFSWKGKEYAKELLINSNAIVEKVLGPKLYLVSLEDGTKLTAHGSESIKAGTKVSVSSLLDSDQNRLEKKVERNTEKSDQFSILMPFKVGNKTSEAKIDIYVEREKQEILFKRNGVVYLVFSVKTTTYGQIQWSIYLKGNQILIQVYAEKDGIGKKGIIQMIRDFEVSLKKKGFSLLAPTVILKKPFKVPTGFRLNIQG